MTPVIKATYSPVDDRYPIVIAGPTWWEKLSVDEALALAKELHVAVASASVRELLEEAA